jgi:hypothetical protein
MTPEMQAFLDALTLYINDSVMAQLTDIVSFAAGIATGLAFVTASKFRWH